MIAFAGRAKFFETWLLGYRIMLAEAPSKVTNGLHNF